MEQLDREKLPGTVKSKWAIEYKMKMDQVIEDALKAKLEKEIKLKTKGRFQIQARTNAGNWMMDRDWKNSANPSLQKAEIAREEFDLKLIQKRQDQKRIQNMALEQ